MDLPEWIVTDLDDTLLLEDRSVGKASLEIIARIRQKGVQFAIATTRNKSFAQSYIDQLNPDVSVVSGGALTYKGSTIIRKRTLDESQIDTIYQTLGGNFSIDKIVIDSIAGRFVDLNEIKEIPSNSIFSLFIWTDENLGLLKTDSNAIEITRLWEDKMYRISHKEASKHAALLDLLKDHEPEKVITFGDDLMDIGMLKHFNGVAVANALEEVKEAAKEITQSNRQQGVAKYLERFL
ncbi:MAG: HAD family hydrolase [Sphaerochaetaceae bacterium]